MFEEYLRIRLEMKLLDEKIKASDTDPSILMEMVRAYNAKLVESAHVFMQFAKQDDGTYWLTEEQANRLSEALYAA